jgi:hypothetical protein
MRNHDALVFVSFPTSGTGSLRQFVSKATRLSSRVAFCHSPLRVRHIASARIFHQAEAIPSLSATKFATGLSSRRPRPEGPDGPVMLAALMVGEAHPIVTARSGSVQIAPGGGAWGKGGRPSLQCQDLPDPCGESVTAKITPIMPLNIRGLEIRASGSQ